MKRLAFCLTLGLLLLLLLLLLLTDSVLTANEEIYLQKNLSAISTYSIYARPVKKPADPTKIQMSYYLEHVLSVDGSQQTMTLSGLLLVTWLDQLLTWNASKYAGITVTRRAVSAVWAPQFFISNSAGDQQRIVPDTQSDQVTVYNNGLVYFERKLLTVTSCTMDVVKFPSDSQYCTVKFSVEGYTKNEIVMAAENNYDAKDFFIKSQEWTLTDSGNYVTKVSMTPSKSNSISLTIPQYVFWVKVKRNSAYYNSVIVYPLVMLAVLLILCFFLPVESGEKVSLGITILLAFTVYMLLMDGLIPKTNNLPYLMNYLTGLLGLSTFTIFFCAFVLRVYYVDPRSRMPDGLYTFLITGLGTAVGQFGFCKKAPPRKTVSSRKDDNDSSRSLPQIEGKTKQVDWRPVEPEEEWQVAAEILDRLFMYLGTIVLIFMSISLLVIAPASYNATQIPSSPPTKTSTTS